MHPRRGAGPRQGGPETGGDDDRDAISAKLIACRDGLGFAAPFRMETVEEKLRRSRRTLERQIEAEKTSFDTREVLDRLAELEKRNDQPDDTLVGHSDA